MDGDVDVVLGVQNLGKSAEESYPCIPNSCPNSYNQRAVIPLPIIFIVVHLEKVKNVKSIARFRVSESVRSSVGRSWDTLH